MRAGATTMTNVRAKSMRMHVLSYSLQSALPSILALAALEIVVHFFVCRMFASSHDFPIGWVPFAAMVGASLVLYMLFSLIIELRFKKRQ